MNKDNQWIERLRKKGRNFRREVPDDLYSGIMENMPVQEIPPVKTVHSYKGWLYAASAVAAVIATFFILDITVFDDDRKSTGRLAGRLSTTSSVSDPELIERIIPSSETLLSDGQDFPRKNVPVAENGLSTVRRTDASVSAPEEDVSEEKVPDHILKSVPADGSEETVPDGGFEETVPDGGSEETVPADVAEEKADVVITDADRITECWEEMEDPVVSIPDDAVEVRETENRKDRDRIVSASAFYAGTFSSPSSEHQGISLAGAEPFGTYSQNLSSENVKGPLKSKDALTTSSRHHMPVKVGLGLGFKVAKRWTVGTGVDYSYLHSEFDIGSGPLKGHTDQNLHFIGIPLNVRFSMIRHKFLDFYVIAGMETEKMVAGRSLTVHHDVSGNASNITDKIKDSHFYYSAGASLGLAFKLNRTLNFYVEPGFIYHFQNKSPLQTVWSDRPADFSLNFGFRFDI